MTVELTEAIEQDSLIRGLLDAQQKKVEIIAFGIAYVGVLQNLDIDNGTLIIRDGDDHAVLEIERIESVSLIQE